VKENENIYIFKKNYEKGEKIVLSLEDGGFSEFKNMFMPELHRIIDRANI